MKDIQHYHTNPDFERILGEKLLKIMKGDTSCLFKVILKNDK